MLRKLCGLTVALATVSVAPVASAQVWSEHKGGGLLLNNMELKQTVRNGSLENAVSMNKYALVFNTIIICAFRHRRGCNIAAAFRTRVPITVRPAR